MRLLGERGAAATPGVDDVATTGGDTALQQVSLLQKRAPMAGRCCMGEGTRVLQGVAACRGGVAAPGAASERGMAMPPRAQEHKCSRTLSPVPTEEAAK